MGGPLNWMIAWRAAFSVGSAIVLCHVALRMLRERNVSSPTDRNRNFRTRIGFTRLDGMASLSLLLANESETNVWAEEIEVSLTGLNAEQQTAEPSFRGVQKIRQMVGRQDTLPISLAEAIYKAAGDPQRKYSCVLSSVLRFRIGEECFERQLGNYRIRMIGLTAEGISRERKPIPPFQPPSKSPDVAAVAARLK
jgi:hypothetical protein